MPERVGTVVTIIGALGAGKGTKVPLTSRSSRSTPRRQALGDDLEVENLFDDPLVIAVGVQTNWARRRKVALADLIDASWILSGSDTWNHVGLTKAFEAIGSSAPKVSIVTLSIPLRIDLLATDEFVTALPKSVADRYAGKVLPIELPVEPWSVATVTLKRKTLSPVVAHFVESAREVAKSFATQPHGRKY